MSGRVLFSSRMFSQQGEWQPAASIEPRAPVSKTNFQKNCYPAQFKIAALQPNLLRSLLPPKLLPFSKPQAVLSACDGDQILARASASAGFSGVPGIGIRFQISLVPAVTRYCSCRSGQMFAFWHLPNIAVPYLDRVAARRTR
jgi:hypothetical protein